MDHEFNGDEKQVEKEKSETQVKTNKRFPIPPPSKSIFRYAGIALIILLILVIGFKLASKSSPVYGKIGFYMVFIPLWIGISIAILMVLSMIEKILRFSLIILTILGIILIFGADRPIEGLMALGPVGLIMIALLNLLLITVLISLLPGIIVGVVALFVVSEASPELGVLVGLITLVAVTISVFKFIWEWVIPFSIGFSICLLVGKIVSAIVSLIFIGNRIIIPNTSAILSSIKSSRGLGKIGAVFDGLDNLWEGIKLFWSNYPVIFIGAVIFGFLFAGMLNSDEDKEE